MDRFTLAASVMFLLSDVFIITSLSLPDWIVSDVAGRTRLGLLRSCVTVRTRPEVCFTPPRLCGEWMMGLICIFLGCFFITITVVMLALGLRSRQSNYAARWLGFSAMVLLCLAAVILPVGFQMVEIGGKPYHLPPSYQLGTAYFLFIVAIWITAFAELFASRLCMPGRGVG